MTKLNNFMQTNFTQVNNDQQINNFSSNKPVAKTSQGFYVPTEKPSK